MLNTKVPANDYFFHAVDNKESTVLGQKAWELTAHLLPLLLIKRNLALLRSRESGRAKISMSKGRISASSAALTPCILRRIPPSTMALTSLLFHVAQASSPAGAAAKLSSFIIESAQFIYELVE